tara:strand:+ start:10387 stop:10953 length:567 start_codon:yes stop_codon:yes gene_type:complete
MDESNQEEFKIARDIIDGKIGNQIRSTSSSDEEFRERMAHALSACLEHQLHEMTKGDRNAADDFMDLIEEVQKAEMRRRDIVAIQQAKLSQVQNGHTILHILLLEIMQENDCEEISTSGKKIKRRKDFRTPTFEIPDMNLLPPDYLKTDFTRVIDALMVQLHIEEGKSIPGVKMIEREEVLHIFDSPV